MTTFAKARVAAFAGVILALAAAGGACGQTLAIPADPIKAVDGDWYGEDANLKLEIRDGVVTAREVKTTDSYLTNGKVRDGVVVARWSSFNGPSRNNSFGGQCWTAGGEGWGLQPCGEAGNISVGRNSAGKAFYRLYVLNRSFRRKADIDPVMWSARK